VGVGGGDNLFGWFDARYTLSMWVLPLDVALTVMVIATFMIAVQLIIVTVEISALRRDVMMLLRITSALNLAVNPWAGENEPTDPRMRPPPIGRRCRWLFPIRRK
jgi:hypothetical protein